MTNVFKFSYTFQTDIVKMTSSPEVEYLSVRKVEVKKSFSQSPGKLGLHKINNLQLILSMADNSIYRFSSQFRGRRGEAPGPGGPHRTHSSDRAGLSLSSYLSPGLSLSSHLSPPGLSCSRHSQTTSGRAGRAPANTETPPHPQPHPHLGQLRRGLPQPPADHTAPAAGQPQSETAPTQHREAAPAAPAEPHC